MDNTTCYNIDLHVHTSKHSQCAETLDPWQICSRLKQANLHGVVITEHDTLWNSKELYELQLNCKELDIYNGIEVSTGDGCHVIVIGVGDIGPLRRGISVSETLQYTHEQGGVAILAHPYRKNLPPLHIVDHFDAIEVCSTSLSEREAKLARHLATTLDKPQITCSDAHALSMIGWGYLTFPRRPENSSHLCSMIKEGEGIAVQQQPFFQQ